MRPPSPEGDPRSGVDTSTFMRSREDFSCRCVGAGDLRRSERGWQVAASEGAEGEQVTEDAQEEQDQDARYPRRAGPGRADIDQPVAVEHRLLRLVIEEERQRADEPRRLPELPDSVGDEHDNDGEHRVAGDFPSTSTRG